MKSIRLGSHVAMFLLLIIAGGCGKNDNAGGVTSESNSTNSLSATAADLRDTAQQAVGELRSTAETATAEVGRQAQAVTDQAQRLIDQAKSLISERKYTEAWDALARVSGMQLTLEQKKVVEDLKSELQKLMASPGVSNAASSVRRLLNN